MIIDHEPRSLLMAALVALFLTSLPLEAQSARFGISPNGRNDADMHDQTRQYEKVRKVSLELEQVDEEAWKKRALAWIRCRNGDGVLEVPEVYRVDGLEAGKKAEVEAVRDGEEPPTFTVRYGKKLKSLSLVLSDRDATEVKCATATLERGESLLGVFFVDGLLHCFGREAG